MIHLVRSAYARLAGNLRYIRASSTKSSPKAPPALPYSKRQPSSKFTPPEPPAADEPQSRFRWPRVGGWNVALVTLNLFIAGHLTTTYVFTIRPCVGPSMLPTLNYSGDYVLVSKLHARMKWIKVGDLVSYHHPVRRGHYGIKRVIGMPGDFVLRDTPGKGDGTMVRVPPGHCWVTGDNLEASRDSRMFGALPIALVRGKIVGRVWPDPTLFNKPFSDPVYLDDD